MKVKQKPKLLKTTYLYCIIENGHLCKWSIATNIKDAWNRFEHPTRGDKRFDREEAKKKGLRCARLKIEEV